MGAIIIYRDFDLKFTSMFFAAAAVYTIVSLFKYIDKISRDLMRFLSSIKYSDFSQTYLFKNFGANYGELYKSVAATYSELSSNRIRAEENIQYLNTLIEQVPSGIISFKSNGEIELINKAAKRILNSESIGNINLIKDEKNHFRYILDNVEIGKEKTIKLNTGGKEKIISVFKSVFKLRDQIYTLITLKDLEDELEKERLENELNIAQSVQVSLLPKELPAYTNYEISVLFKPAKRVGGDFYDFFELGNNKLGIIIGDVSGKGLGAAIYTTLLKGIFKTLAVESSDTVELLTKANALLYRMIDKRSFITAIYAVLDTEKNILAFSRAGHEPLLHYCGTEKNFKSYKQKGLGLGLAKGEILNGVLEEQQINVCKDDSILFYTDGLVDLKMNAGNYDSLEDFKKIVSADYGKGPQKIISVLEEEITSYNKNVEQFDDITVIMIKRKN